MEIVKTKLMSQNAGLMEVIVVWQMLSLIIVKTVIAIWWLEFQIFRVRKIIIFYLKYLFWFFFSCTLWLFPDCMIHGLSQRNEIISFDNYNDGECHDEFNNYLCNFYGGDCCSENSSNQFCKDCLCIWKNPTYPVVTTPDASKFNVHF